MKKLITIVILLASFSAVKAQTVLPAEVPLRKDGITVKRLESTDTVAVVEVKKKSSLFSRKKKKSASKMYRCCTTRFF